MRFSIVTPVLNGARFLEDAISSISAQSYPDWEHIIVDGGSTDGGDEMAKDWAAREPRAQFISAPGEGLYASIFRGFSVAQGEFLSWLNCDDLYAPWALATFAADFERNNSPWMTGLPGVWDAGGRLRIVRPVAHRPAAWIRRGWYHEGFLGCLQQESMVFSRRLFGGLSEADRNAVTTLKLAGDFLIWRLFARHAALRIIPTVVGGIRIHGANMSIVRREEYNNEVRSLDAPFPPKPVARLLELADRLSSAIRIQRLIDAENRALRSTGCQG